MGIGTGISVRDREVPQAHVPLLSWMVKLEPLAASGAK